jgi:hypothetical protein
MSNPREKRVTIHHPELRAEKTVRQRQADVLATSGWKSGPLPKTKTDKE